eukprot:TRINITY_DN18419_c0_g2_i1.p1 TRINITY_DN18419_c0_g2~~TRINITY_DN18419_c0_g2_i1.p1  ORF type:complete len:224 (-),score=24.99 TRINITY_DN18419_c0_g2_i1:118-789(-)
MRTISRRSMLRANIFLIECAFVLAAYLFVLLTPGLVWDGLPVASCRLRLLLLAAFGVVYMVRLNVMSRWLLPRELSCEELTIVPLMWLPAILASYSLAAICSSGPVNIVDILSTLLYVVGSFLNSWSELQRKRWKAREGHAGRLFTEGLFALARNINYFGDVVLFAGWACATQAWWNAWVPVVMGLSFYFFHIPDKETYLRKRYADEWPDYEARTKALIPSLL